MVGVGRSLASSRRDTVPPDGHALDLTSAKKGVMNRYHIARQSHVHCMVCGERTQNPGSLNLLFTRSEEGSIHSSFLVTEHHQGYTGVLHGGMTSTLLDAAMTHCLLMEGIQALTAELTVRFLAPIRVGQQVQLGARLVSQRRAIYQLEAWIGLGSQQLARASAKFMAESGGAILNDR